MVTADDVTQDDPILFDPGSVAKRTPRIGKMRRKTMVAIRSTRGD